MTTPTHDLPSETAYRFIGTHVLADVVDIPQNLVNDEELLLAAMHQGIQAAGATLCGLQVHRFQPNGMTALFLLAESHVSIHTYPENGALFLDAFTCGTRCRPEIILDVLTRELGPCTLIRAVVRRGEGGGWPHNRQPPWSEVAGVVALGVRVTGDIDTDGLGRLNTVRAWLEQVLGQPHPQLGRDGDVCPFVARSLRRDLLTLRQFDAARGAPALGDLVRLLRTELAATSSGHDAPYRAAAIVPYGRPDTELAAVVARVQRELKPELVEQGFMIGEFWPDHPMPGMHNPHFRPLASPVPVLAIRHMVMSDLPFLTAAHIAPGDRERYVGAYARAMGVRLTRHWRDQLELQRRSIKQVGVVA
jgi:S-adenosylmethionine decarboxylase